MYVGDIRDLWCSGFVSGCWLKLKIIILIFIKLVKLDLYFLVKKFF